MCSSDLSHEIQETADPTRLDQLYAQADELEIQMQQTEVDSTAAKKVIREIRSPILAHAESIQQLDAKAKAQLATLFGAVPTTIDEAADTRISEEADLLMQEWQQVVADFTGLRDTALRRVPELGPLFEQPLGGAQQERARGKGTAEQSTGTSGAMEVETVICD